MAVIKLPDMDAVTTRTDLMNYFKALRRAMSEVNRHLATDAGMLRAMLKAQDEKYGIKAGAACVRPMLWVAMILYSTRRALTLAANRIHLNYAPENRNAPRSRRTSIDMDK